MAQRPINMQAVFMDTTPDMLPTNLCKPWVCNNSGKQTIAKKMKADLDERIENRDKELGGHHQKSNSETRSASTHTSRNGKVLMKTKPVFLSMVPHMLTNTVSQSQNPNPNLAVI